MSLNNARLEFLALNILAAGMSLTKQEAGEMRRHPVKFFRANRKLFVLFCMILGEAKGVPSDSFLFKIRERVVVEAWD